MKRWLAVALVFWMGPASASGPSYNTDTAAMASLFLDSCIDGKVALAEYGGEQVPRNRLPASEWDDARGSSSAKYYRIRKPISGYLIIADYLPPTGGGQTKLCMLNSDQNLNLSVQVSEVQKRLFGQVGPPNRQAGSYQIVLPDQQALITLLRHQMYVQFLTPKAMEKLPKKISAAFDAPYMIN